MSKNIVVCYDGTGNAYGKNNTNVVGVYEAIVRDSSQIAFYDPSVGTFSFLGRSLGRHAGIVLGKAFGMGFHAEHRGRLRVSHESIRSGR